MPTRFHLPSLLVLWAILANAAFAGIQAGAARIDITPPVGIEIQHYFRTSVGVNDPLFVRCLYLADANGNEVAIVSLDLIFADFLACDSIRAEIKKTTGVEHALLAFSHSHSSMALGARGRPTSESDEGGEWNDKTIDAILKAVQSAKASASDVTLCYGRETAQVGFNRRLVNKETGRVYMGVNREGPVVPWVNVLVANSKETGKPIAVLYQHAAHPVIVPDKSNKISADFPGAAAKRIREKLGEDVIALFGQGCAGNINGFPLRTTHENADAAGQKLGDAVLRAVDQCTPIESEVLSIATGSTRLPSHALPDNETWQQWYEEGKNDERRKSQLDQIRKLMDSNQPPPARRFDAWSISFGNEWALTSMPHEMFCQYELWIDKVAPFKNTMTLAYTNGYEGYVAIDEAWKLNEKGGYEAGSLPNWGGQVWTRHLGPPAVGSEDIIKDLLKSLWNRQPKSAQQFFKVEPTGSETEPTLRRILGKRVSVFRIDVLASNDTPDNKVLHAANVLAQYLDNDEDGKPDNPKVLEQLVARRGGIIMFANERNAERADVDTDRDLVGLWGSETIPNGASKGQFDATLEEVIHLVTSVGYANAYPAVFGEKPASAIANAMDKARGGHFRRVPRKYPPGAWYTYYDETCDYGCQVTEYTYWGLTSVLGGQEFEGRLEQIEEEWALNTHAKVKAKDPDLYKILTNERYRLPTQLPDGKYRPTSN